MEFTFIFVAVGLSASFLLAQFIVFGIFPFRNIERLKKHLNGSCLNDHDLRFQTFEMNKNDWMFVATLPFPVLGQYYIHQNRNNYPVYYFSKQHKMIEEFRKSAEKL